MRDARSRRRTRGRTRGGRQTDGGERETFAERMLAWQAANGWPTGLIGLLFVPLALAAFVRRAVRWRGTRT